VEDRAVPYRGGKRWAKEFLGMLERIEVMDPKAPDFVARVEAELDATGFLRYMAAQMIMANVDWPDQNVRYWRHTGAVDSLNPCTDGRWRFVMGDSDLGFGNVVDAGRDMVAHVRQRHTPVPRLYKALLRSLVFRERFLQQAGELLQGPLGTSAMLAAVDGLAAEMRPEIPAHIDRWRRPASTAVWERHVETLRTFARQRPANFAEHLRKGLPRAGHAAP